MWMVRGHVWLRMYNSPTLSHVQLTHPTTHGVFDFCQADTSMTLRGRGRSI